MQKKNHFDYIIIGNGLAGLQLALGFANESFFDSKSIALIDPSSKTTNDKTWSFWEKGEGQWDSIVHKSYNQALFYSDTLDLTIPLHDYIYKSIRSIDFYKHVQQQLEASLNIQFITDYIQDVEESDKLLVKGAQSNYTAGHIFDSRIPNDFYTKDSKFSTVHQHFKGWIITTDTPSFLPDKFTMMDYRFNYKQSTSFIYLLPFSETKALVEFTFFTPYTVDEEVYDNALKDYINNHLKLNTYEIVETEMGNIPMTDFPFWEYHTKRVTKIGTGGGWVKGSTGYSFKHTEKYVSKIIHNIKNGKNPSSKLFKSKFKFYDSIFLDVLSRNNDKGIWIFERFYSKNTVATMFRFLDEETSFKEDIHIMKSLFSMTFIKAFFRVLFRP